MTSRRAGVLIAVVAFLSAIAGTFAGRALFADRAGSDGTALHRLLHEKLDLDAGQQAALDRLEARFATRRQALEMEMRADNARLAEAIEAEHGNGPQVAAAIDRSHRAMGELQKETVAHVFAMRKLLRPDQAERFDKAVVKALTQTAQ
jgi:hypothetical protein